MRKFFSVILLAGMITCSVSCSGNSPESSDVLSSSENAAPLLSFKSADINMANDFSEIYCTDKRSANYLIFGKLNSGEYCGYITNTEFAEKRSFTFTPQEGETFKSAALMRFGKAAVLSTLGSSTLIHTFDANGDPENTYDLGELISPDDHFAELLCTENEFYINIDRHTLAYADADGNYKGDINTNGRTVCGIVNDCDDSPCVLLSEKTEMTLATLSENSIAEEQNCGELAEYTNAVCTGMGDYRIAVIVGNGLYGLKENSWVKLTDFSENEFSSDCIWDMDMVGENEFVVKVESNNCRLRLLSQRDISEIKQKQIIRIASTVLGGGDPYDDLMKKYNSQSDDYKIEVVEYKGEVPAECDEALRLDIVSGNAPDIVFFSGDMPVESFGDEESMFVDLYKLMENDPDISREDFLEGYLEALETKGKLLQVNNRFAVRSPLKKEKFTKGLTTWNMEQFKEIVSSRPEDMDVLTDEKSKLPYYIMYDLIGFERFYSRLSSECQFDSPDFIDALKFIKESHLGLYQNDPPEEHDVYPVLQFRNENILLYIRHMMSFSELKEQVRIYGDDRSIFIGFPNDDGVNAVSLIDGGYGILANSPNADGAWDFLKYYLFSEDSYNDEPYQFNPIEKYYKRTLADDISLIDPETGEEQHNNTFPMMVPGMNDDMDMIIRPFTNEEAEKYDKFVREAVKHHVHNDAVIRNILYEELPFYFEGEKSAEEIADIIQNRATIYLSEQS